MGLIEHHLPLTDLSDAALPPASTYRLFQCHCCLQTVEICSRCDRGNIYCKVCAPIRKAERIARAHKAYRSSENGKSVRSKAEKLRRLRGSAKKSEGTVGDRGSLPGNAQGNTSVSGQVSSESGVNANEVPVDSVSAVVAFELPPPPQGFVRCVHCLGLCKAFQIQGPRGRVFSRRSRSRSPPGSPSYRGGDP
jgi:hypothetical protein